jgi:hypothetical protein
MSDGELASVFKGLAEDADQAAGKIAHSVAGISEKTAANEEANLARTLDTEDQAARSFANIHDPAAGTPKPSSSTIGSRLDGGTPPVGQYQPSEAELALQQRQIVDTRPLNPGAHANEAHLVTFADGTRGVYKPIAGEDASLRQGIPDGLANREVAASRMDEAFGFGRVPTTTIADGAHGPGSIQQWSESTPPLPHNEYPRIQQEQMAVSDYVTGNTDRHLGNYLTDPNGNIVAIDHGYSFPESPDPRFGIRSDFVDKNLNTPLSDEVMANVRAVDPAQVRDMLAATGLRAPAVDGVIARLTEVQTHGMITGEAWPGVINGAFAPPATVLMTNPLRSPS